MSNQRFLIFWNELSFIKQGSGFQTEESGEWRSRALQSFEALKAIFTLREDCRFIVVRGSLNLSIGERPLQSWLEEWLGKDRVRKLKGKLIAIDSLEKLNPIHEFDCEISCQEQRGEGLTRAYVLQSWVWSIGSAAALCHENTISANKTLISSTLAETVAIPNLACEQHVNYWRADLESWGNEISPSSVIAKVGEYQVVMYPFDHWPPHIHVSPHSDPGTYFRYRIDEFKLLPPVWKARPNGLDSQIERWIDDNREDLMRSWQRCERGDMPLKLKDSI
jgi:hypothetical protein